MICRNFVKINFYAKIYLLIFPVFISSCSNKHALNGMPYDSGNPIARTAAIIRSARPGNPRRIKILFYGQSISTPKWTDQAMVELQTHYPNVAFDTKNLALGGFSADRLEHTAARDVAEFYPDLIIFHVYGDNRAYERIIRIFRSQTAADIIVSTDHVTAPVEPICDTGFHFEYTPPPGCKGHFWFKQNSWEQFMSGVWIPAMARKYNLAVEPRRQRWNSYIEANHLPPAALLADSPHPNARGWRLMAKLFTSWFEEVIDSNQPAHPPLHSLVSVILPPTAGKHSIYRFSGNRLELLGSGALATFVQVRVDGRPTADIDGCWQDSRVTRLANVPDWPGLARVSVASGYHRPDRWTLRLFHFSPAQDRFEFALSSDLGGADGNGQVDAGFQSPSGRVTIDPADWWPVAAARRLSGRSIPEGFTMHWQRQFVCTDQPAVHLPGGGIEQRFVVATGLANGPHRVEITLLPGAPRVFEIRSYEPPLPA